MNRYSDSESLDSDEGIRFKTDSVRRKQESLSSSRAERSRSRSPRFSDDSRSNSIMGPELPPHLLKPNQEISSFGPKLPRKDTEEASSFGPKLPPHLIGPQLPPHLKEDTGNSVVIGPQLPPQLVKKPAEETSPNIGPQLPPKNPVEENPNPSVYIGPQLPPHLRQKLQDNAPNEESDEEVYGPLPVGASNMSEAQIALEERALQLKMDQLEPKKDKPIVREEWMLELPEVKASKFGLGPRQFRAKAGPDLSDRTSWTDTPEKKKKKVEKVDLKKEAELKETRKRDEEQERISKKHKKKNKESLLEMHQSKMKKKKEEEPVERRPFSRDIDLQVNRFDEAQKKAVLKKAQLLDDRFSSGQSKFL